MSYDVTARFFHWMEANNITRQDAAKLLGVDERSLSTYRSRGLPRKKEARANQIMLDHAPPSPFNTQEDNRIFVTFRDEDFEIVDRAANIVGSTTREFIQKAAVHFAKEKIAKLRVAEDPPNEQTGTDSKP